MPSVIDISPAVLGALVFWKCWHRMDVQIYGQTFDRYGMAW